MKDVPARSRTVFPWSITSNYSMWEEDIRCVLERVKNDEGERGEKGKNSFTGELLLGPRLRQCPDHGRPTKCVVLKQAWHDDIYV